ncbi:MAG: c-type cytochrome [Pseudomonadota bacterium]
MRLQLTTLFLIGVLACSSQAHGQIDDSFVERAGCVQCHGAANQGTGPSFDEIAQRYEGSDSDRAQMRETVLNGGSGNWSKVTGGKAMPPYSNLLSAEEVDALIDWVLAR